MAKKQKSKRPTLNYNIWNTNIPVVIEQDIKEHNPSRINIFAAEEHEIASTWSGDFNILKKLFIDNDVEVHFIYGAANMEFYNTRYHFPEHRIYTHLWPFYYLSFTLSSMKHNEFVNHADHNNPTFTTPFISMNNRPHNHRCMFMDQMARYNLIDTGSVSWHNDNVPYQWKWWKTPQRLKLVDDFSNNGNSYRLPIEWKSSFMNLVSECSINRIYFSEKTWIPLLCHKVFLSQSDQYFYKKFKECGFELYDEIFDYSFDDYADADIRTSMIMENVKNIIGKDYNAMHNLLLPKLKHNFNRAITIATNNEYIPKIAKNSEFAMELYTALKDIQTSKRFLLSLKAKQ